MANENLDLRQRKFWGWGFASEVTDAVASDAILHALHDRLDLPIQDFGPGPTISEIELKSPRVPIPASLAAICSDMTWDRAEHTYGKNLRDYVRGFERRFDNPPDFVAFPRTEDDLTAILDWACTGDVAVIPYGGGSSVASGIEPDVGDSYRGVITVDLRHLNQVLEVDRASRSALIQAGALGPDLEAQLKPHGLTLRFYLQSFRFSTLGGWIATRAAGHFATMYTQIDDAVQAMRVLTPRGIVETRRLPSDGAGTSADRLFIGSEGTLGIITQAWMRLRDRPTFRASVAVPFRDFDAAWQAVRHVSQSDLWPANCRLLNPTEALLSGAGNGSTSVVLLGFESADHPVEPLMARAAEICASFGGLVPAEAMQGRSATDANLSGAAGVWRNFFIKGPEFKEIFTRHGILRETFETACTWRDFPGLHAGVIDAATRAMRAVCGTGHVACRFTHVYPDGPAPYYTVLAPAKKGAELEQWAAIKAAASDAVLAAGGTITHHHAVGRFHRPWYDRQRPDLFAEAMRAAKTALDPAAVMNPGVLIDP